MKNSEKYFFGMIEKDKQNYNTKTDGSKIFKSDNRKFYNSVKKAMKNFPEKFDDNDSTYIKNLNNNGFNPNFVVSENYVRLPTYKANDYFITTRAFKKDVQLQLEYDKEYKSGKNIGEKVDFSKYDIDVDLKIKCLTDCDQVICLGNPAYEIVKEGNTFTFMFNEPFNGEIVFYALENSVTTKEVRLKINIVEGLTPSEDSKTEEPTQEDPKSEESGKTDSNIPTEQYYEFIVSVNKNKVNLFSNNSVKKLDDYDVYINDELTTQKYNSLTFVKGDKIKIQANKDVELYPMLFCESLNVIEEITHPLPKMTKDFKVAVNSLNDMFYGCTSITKLPEYMFYFNPQITSLKYTFSNLSNLKSIPSTIFKNCYLITTVYGCFESNASLKVLPRIFEDNKEISNFTDCFTDCDELETIEETFEGLTSESIIFNYTFSGDANITSALPELWKMYPNAKHSGCFEYCKKASNYEDAKNAKWVG
jgi:hypothetical protein